MGARPSSTSPARKVRDVGDGARAGPRLHLPDVSDEIVPGHRLVRRTVGLVLALFVVVLLLAAISSALVTMDVTVDANGTIEPLELWSVRARAPGLVAAIMVSSGDTVQRGQVVARLDTLSLTDAQQSLRFEYEKARVDYDRARAIAPLERDRQRELIAQAAAKVVQARASLLERLTEYHLGQNVDSVLESYVSGRHVAIDRAVADVRLAEAEHKAAVLELEEAGADSSDVEKRRIELARLRSALEIGDAQRSRMTIASPTDGVVLTEQLSRKVGSYVEPGELLLEVAPTDGWRAVLFVREHDVHEVDAGDKVSLEIPALTALYGDRIQGRVASVALQPVGSAGSGTDQLRSPTSDVLFRVVASLDETQLQRIGPEQLRRGYVASAKIVTRSDRVLNLLVDYVKERVAGIW
jgi:multidrug resistance efflux pump